MTFINNLIKILLILQQIRPRGVVGSTPTYHSGRLSSITRRFRDFNFIHEAGCVPCLKALHSGDSIHGGPSLFPVHSLSPDKHLTHDLVLYIPSNVNRIKQWCNKEKSFPRIMSHPSNYLPTSS